MYLQQFKNKIKLALILNKTKEKYSGLHPNSSQLVKRLVEWLEDLDTLLQIKGLEREESDLKKLTLFAEIIQHLQKKPTSSYFYNILDQNTQYKGNMVKLYRFIFENLDLTLDHNKGIANCLGAWDIDFYLNNKTSQSVDSKEAANIQTIMELSANWKIQSFVDLEKRVDLLTNLSILGIDVSEGAIKNTLKFMKYSYDHQTHSSLLTNGQSYDLLSLISKSLSYKLLPNQGGIVRKEFLTLLALDYSFNTINTYQSITGGVTYEDKQDRDKTNYQLLCAPLKPEDMNTIITIKEKAHLDSSIAFIKAPEAKKPNKI